LANSATLQENLQKHYDEAKDQREVDQESIRSMQVDLQDLHYRVQGCESREGRYQQVEIDNERVIEGLQAEIN
jgi:hypothetical protein|tara:strand:+ start:67 stop:285 length:219 start_codon:yes stop_codon:yes gene_type:complete